MYKHILIAADGSERGNIGVDHGIALAASIGAKVTIVTVTEPWSALDIAAEARKHDVDVLAEFDARATASSQKVLNAASQRASAAGIKFGTLHIPHTHPSDGIIKTAETRGCDLIVMSSHGRRGIQRVLLGSQAYEVVTLSKVPVLIVR